MKFLISIFLLLLSASKMFAQCPIDQPLIIDACNIGAASLELQASEGTGFYSWYDAPTGGNLIHNGATFTTPVLNSTTNYYVASADTFFALSFDGNDDYVALNSSYNTAGQISELTLEAWVNTTVNGEGAFDNWSIIDFDRSEYFNFFVSGSNGEVGFSTSDVNGTVHDFYSGSLNVVNDGAWHHIAAVYDGTDKIIYIDGLEVARNTNTHGGNNLGTGLTRFGFIGDGSEATTFNGTRNNRHYNGSVNEIRIWNTVRTPAEIASNKDFCLTGSETGLEHYYSLNEGSRDEIKDITGNGGNGILFNFNLASAWIIGNDFNCLSCESPRTIATATIEPGVNLGADICSITGTETLDAGAGFSNYLWNTGETTQTINVSTNGTYSVTVQNANSCSGADTIKFTSFITPIGSDGCSNNLGTADLSVTGSSGYYRWYDAPVGGNVVNLGSTFTTPVLNTTTSYYVAATDTSSSLEFDGVNDYIAIDNISYNGSGNTALTVEAWINTSSGDDQIIASFDRSEFWRFEINGNGGGTGQIGFDLMTTTGQLDFGSTTRIDDGEWHHVAGVFDNGTVSIYIDGVLDATTTTGTTFGTNLTRFGFIGTGSEASTFNGSRGPSNEFNGQMDEVRVWNVARSASEIAASRNSCLNGSESGLSLYYDFDEEEGTTANDKTNNNNSGSLFNFNSSSAWVDDSPISCSTCESLRTTVNAFFTEVNLVDQQLTCGNTNITLDAGAGFSSYLWSTGETTQTINVNQQGVYSINANSTNGCSVLDTLSIIGFTSSENALTLDGANDYLAIDNLTYSGTGHTALTVETWIKTSSGGNQVIASFDRNQFWRLEINGNGGGTGQIGFDLMTSSGQIDFGSTTRIDDGLWHHVAGVFDNGTVSIYIDGVLDATTTTGSTFGTNVTRYGFVSRGSEASTFNGTTGPNNEVNGEMDEFRIWNVARSQTEIRNSMCSHIPGNETGLEVYYKFDNISANTFEDYSTSTSSPATLINFGGTSTVTSGVPLGDISTHIYPTTASSSLNLSSCEGDNLTIQNITGSPAGMHLYFVNNDPNTTGNILDYTTNNHYFGTFSTNTTTEYDLVYNYNNHPLVVPSDEEDLALLTRADNTIDPWLFSSSSINTTSNEITLTNQNPGQFILDNYRVQWTGATNTDWAIGNNWNIGNVPPIGANITIPDVVNQPILDQDRTVGNFTLETLADVDLNAFSLNIQRNLINDGNVISNNGTLNFNGTTDQQFIFANVNLNLDNVTIDNTDGVTLSNGSIDLSNTLTLSNGNFSTNNAVTLLSNASGTARIAEITGGSISGDITMERYIDAGSTNWRFLTSAVSGTTIADFNDDFITSGFTGSDFPLWPVASNPWTSIYFYDETQPGIQDNGYVGVTNTSNSLAVGEGLWVWSGDTITGTQAFTIDMSGPANTGNISLPLSYTNTGNVDGDGWNMVGNPYPSTIDWDDPSITKAGINNAIYIWNPDLEQFASYVGGIGTNGGSKNIASSQAFWIQTTTATANIQLTEASKTTDGGTFLKTSVSNLITINVSNNSGADQSVIRFNTNSTINFDPMYDASKIVSVNTSIPSISTITPNNSELSINQLPLSETSIPLKITTGITGFHTIDFSGLDDFSHLSCLLLEDVFNGIIYDLKTTSSISAFISDTTNTAQFLIKFGAITTTSITDVSCYGTNDGLVLIDHQSSTPYDVILKDNQNNMIVNNNNVSGISSLNNISSGNYLLEINNNTCGTIIDSIAVTAPLQVIPEFTMSNDTVHLSNGGLVSFNNTSTNSSYFSWDFGDLSTSSDLSPTHKYLTPGNYVVTLSAFQNQDCFETISKNISVIDLATSIDDVNSNNNVTIRISNDQLIVNGENIEQIEIRNVLGQLLITSTGKEDIQLQQLSSQILIVTVKKLDSFFSSKIEYNK